MWGSYGVQRLDFKQRLQTVSTFEVRDRTGPDRTGPDRTGPDRTGPDAEAKTTDRVFFFNSWFRAS